FYLRTRGFLNRLASPAVCIARFRLDHLLAERFQALGGELRTGQRWTGRNDEPGIVRATGRRLQIAEGQWRWFGLKAHARGVELGTDVEMHFLPHGYVGLCRLDDGRVNVCGLFRRSIRRPQPPGHWKDCLSGPPGSTLRARLIGAQ